MAYFSMISADHTQSKSLQRSVWKQMERICFHRIHMCSVVIAIVQVNLGQPFAPLILNLQSILILSILTGQAETLHIDMALWAAPPTYINRHPMGF